MAPPRSSRAFPPRRTRDQRGSVLIVALLLAALIALALASYLNLNLSSTRLAKRTFGSYGALNLAEAGAEEAVWSFNRATSGDATAWNGWTNNGSAAWQKFANFDLGQNSSGAVKVYVNNVNPGPNAQPKIITQASVTSGSDTAITKMLEVTLRRRSFFANGLVAKDAVVFNGNNASVDSWNSDPDQDASTAAIAYDASVRTDRGTVASTSFVNSAVLINQANIWGYVATGGGQPEVGKNGTIRGADTPEKVMIDPRRISTDFNADFAMITAPVDGTPIDKVGATLGEEGKSTKWRCASLTLSGKDTLTILGQVTLVLTAGSGNDAISVTGNASIIIPKGSKLTVYAEGNIKIGGNGLANSNAQPSTCQFWGTNSTLGSQEIAIAGNGALICTAYAPNADVKINGNGDVMGSVVAYKITLAGNAAFHYDEALAQGESNEPFSIAKWRELTTDAERAAYLSLFEGW